MSDYCCALGTCELCVERWALESRRMAERRAAMDALGISPEQELAMVRIAIIAERSRTRENWVEVVCEEVPPGGLTDVEVLADWYEERLRAERWAWSSALGDEQRGALGVSPLWSLLHRVEVLEGQLATHLAGANERASVDMAVPRRRWWRFWRQS